MTTNENLLREAEQDLLDGMRKLAMARQKITAALYIAHGVDAEAEGFRDEHVYPLADAVNAMYATERYVKRALVEVQSTNPTITKEIDR
jgi:hypothetical protein